MADHSAIEWTDSSWNPVTGCTKVSPGCAHCYAEGLAERLRGTRAFPFGFDFVIHNDRIELPKQWRKPRRIFVNSMSDLFHESVSFSFVDQVFETMHEADHHIYQVLTKRPERLREWAQTRQYTAPSHIWLGTSVENQYWTSRIDHLLATPATIRFLSCEPLLKALDISTYLSEGGINWVIVGGESGRKARPMKAVWVQSLRDQCQDANVAFFFKQWGGRTSKSGGRLLDNQLWNEMPDLGSAKFEMTAT